MTSAGPDAAGRPAAGSSAAVAGSPGTDAEPPAAVTAPTVFRAALAGPVLDLGRAAVVAAVLAVVFVVVAAVASGWPRTLVLVLLVLGLVLTVALGARVLLRLAGRGPRLVLDAAGWTNTTGRAPRRVAWDDVSKLSAVTSGGRRLLVAELADGRTSPVLLRRLRAPAGAVEAAVRDRLNAAHGYRPFR